MNQMTEETTQTMVVLKEQLRRETQRLMDEMEERQRQREAEARDEYSRYIVAGDVVSSGEAGTMDCLLEPILPRVGVAALVGTSDSGKSTLLRGLAMAVVAGMPRYLGFNLKPKHYRALYVSTEDDQMALGPLMRRQMEALDTDSYIYSKLGFIFDTDNLLETLDKSLTAEPADIVVVDAFADLYTGPMNENNRVRSFLNVFSQMAQKHSTLFIFLHHTGKRTESLAPSKHNAIGSQGFEAKMRTMIELRPDPERHDIRHLCIVKGNYLPSEYKHDSFELRFTPSLNFEATGRRVPFSALRERNEEQDEKVAQARALREEGKSYREIAEILGYKSHASVMALLKENEASA